jgi:hypothetical protein
MAFDIESGWHAWIATRRQRITYHDVAPVNSGRTECGRSTRTGAFVTLQTLYDLAAQPCIRCYPPESEVG